MEARAETGAKPSSGKVSRSSSRRSHEESEEFKYKQYEICHTGKSTLTRAMTNDLVEEMTLLDSESVM